MGEYPSLCEFFGLWLEENNKPAGHVGVMYKGAKRLGIFNVKNIDALIIEVFIADKYRRKGLCSYMLKKLFQYLLTEKHISNAHLLVRIRNHPARLVYKKLGGKEEFSAKTFRFCKIPVPFRGYEL